MPRVLTMEHSLQDHMDNNNETIKSTPLENREIIRPIIPEGVIEELVCKVYGLDVVTCEELNSYEDRNYHVTVTDQSNNPHVPEVWTHGYVLKILNSIDSRRPDIVEAQNSLLSYLQKQSIIVPENVPTISGKSMSLEKVFTKNDPKDRDNTPFGCYIVRLLKFIPGDTLFSKPCTPGLLYNVGKYIGRFSNATKGFHHPFYDTHSLWWNLQEFSRLREFIFVVKDDDDKRVINKVLAEFESNILPMCGQFQKGVIHGDLNEQNILVAEVPGQDDVNPESRVYDVIALLDFMHVTDSCRIYDVAINIAYMSVVCNPSEQLDAGGHILAGLLPTFQLNEAELDALPTLVCARLCQSLVMGAYTYQRDPSNQYALTTAKKGWPLLHKLWNTPKQVLKDRWKHVVEQKGGNYICHFISCDKSISPDSTMWDC